MLTLELLTLGCFRLYSCRVLHSSFVVPPTGGVAVALGWQWALVAAASHLVAPFWFFARGRSFWSRHYHSTQTTFLHYSTTMNRNHWILSWTRLVNQTSMNSWNYWRVSSRLRRVPEAIGSHSGTARCWVATEGLEPHYRSARQGCSILATSGVSCSQRRPTEWRAQRLPW